MRKSLRILRALATHHEPGLSVNDVLELTGLERATAYRLMTCLVEERFAERDPMTRRYRLGVDAMHIGFASMRRAPLVGSYQAVLQRLARMSEDTVYLLVRQGDYTLCLAREDGAFPIKIFSTRVGDTRPLGVGVGGMAILAASDDADIARITGQHRPAFDAAGLTASALSRAVARTRRNGYADMVDTVTQGVAGVGAVIASAGSPFAAVSIASIKPRMDAARRAQLGHMLLETLAEVPGNA